MKVEERHPNEISSRAIVAVVAGVLAGALTLVFEVAAMWIMVGGGGEWDIGLFGPSAAIAILLGAVVLPAAVVGGAAGWIAYDRPVLPALVASIVYAFVFPMAFPWHDIPLDLGVWRYDPPAWATADLSLDEGQLLLALILLGGSICTGWAAALLCRVVRQRLRSP